MRVLASRELSQVDGGVVHVGDRAHVSTVTETVAIVVIIHGVPTPKQESAVHVSAANAGRAAVPFPTVCQARLRTPPAAQAWLAHELQLLRAHIQSVAQDSKLK